MKDQPDIQQPTARLMLYAFKGFEAKLEQRLEDKGIFDVTLSHLNVIRHLEPEGLKLVDLARDAGLTKQAVSKSVKDLVEKGYLRFVPDPSDHRAKIIRYTKKGMRLVKVSISIVIEVEQAYIAVLGSAEYNQLRGSLSKLIYLFEEEG